MPDVSIKVMSMNPKREYSIEIKGLDQDQLPEYVAKTYRDLIDLLDAEQIDIKVDNDDSKELLTEASTISVPTPIQKLRKLWAKGEIEN
jgi:hypothetical protein